VVMNIHTRNDCFKFTTGIHTELLYPASRLLTQFTGIGVQPNKAIVGANAFAHEAGIHQDGVLKERTTYEIMSPESVGWAGTSMVLGKHSGRHAFVTRLQELGFRMDGEALENAFEEFKILCDKKKTVYDEDLIVLVDTQVREEDNHRFSLERLSISTGGDKPIATVAVKTPDGQIIEKTESGDGALDAAFSAIKEITGNTETVLVDYRVEAVTGGTDAQGSATIKVKSGDKVVKGRATDTDVIFASVKAFIDAINRIEKDQKIQEPGVV